MALLQLLIPVVLIALGWTFGTLAERRHTKSLDRREKRFRHILVTDIRSFPGGVDPSRHGTLVVGQVVIASDYLKSFLAFLRKIIGGEMHSYQSLMARARREALLRLIEQAHRLGHNAVCNVRYGSSDIGGGTRKKGATMVEMFASGTAYTIRGGRSA